MGRKGLSININFKILDIIVISIVLTLLIATNDMKDNVIAICVLALYFVLKQRISKQRELNKINEESNINKLRYKRAIKGLNGVVWELYEDNSLYISSRARDLLKTDEIIDTYEKFEKYIVEKYRCEVRETFYNFIKSGKTGNFVVDFDVISKEGRIIPIEVKGSRELVDGKYTMYGTAFDLIYKKKQESLLRESEKNYRLALKGTKDIMFQWNIEDNSIKLEGNLHSILYVVKSKSLNVTLEDFLCNIIREDREKILDVYKICIEGNESYYECEFRMKSVRGISWIRLRGMVYNEEGKQIIYGSLSDVSDRKEKEEKIYYMNYYDKITNQPNRRFFEKYTKSKIENYLLENKNLAIACIDLDNLKDVNDNYGHDLGDELLKQFCVVIKKELYKKGFLARFEGDEFVVSIEEYNSKKELEDYLKKIVSIFDKPIRVDTVDVYCTISIGVSFLRDDGTDLKTLLKKADIAMYNAKSLGKNQIRFFDKEIENTIKRNLKITDELKKALERNELYGLLQPKVNTLSKKIEGVEYLIRWNNKELGYVSPYEFITLAEKSGDIIDIGKFIIEDAIKTCRKINDISEYPIKVAINISPIQLRDNEIVKIIEDNLEKYGVLAENIEFEITESTMMNSITKNSKLLSDIKELGITIALDDFGTGYSSFSYLRDLPIDAIKIDKSFIDYIGKDKRSEYIIEKLIELSHYFNLDIVAEGVEYNSQYEFLKGISCDTIQGYYFYKPLSIEETLKIIKE
ncbi:sensor domain-containing protein [Clostridium baratii]|uniref:sensor domain-containing protein n=1 Tax=Clostridium baratii TaxID=1561 RepID=UPI0006BB0E6B|nr:EAL domain-containing protein [Clostridium baratii]